MKNTETLSVSKTEIEQPVVSVEIPSSSGALERLGDINASVIYVQLETGARLSRELKKRGHDVSPATFWINEGWWNQHLNNSNLFKAIAVSFDNAYEAYVNERLAEITEEVSVVSMYSVDDQVEVYMTEDASLASTRESYEMTTLLSTALTEAEENVRNFANIVGYYGVPQKDQYEFLEDLLTHVVEKYHLTLSDAEIAAIVDNFKVELRYAENMEALQEKILTAGSTAYIQAEQEREVEKDPQTNMVERHYLTPDGRNIALLGTEHRYDANDPEIRYLHDIVEAIPEGSNNVLILEGQYGDTKPIPVDPAEAVKVAGGEFGYMAALANRRGIEWIPAEPDARQNAEAIIAERPDITRDQLALHYGLKTLVGIYGQSDSLPLEEVAPYIYHSVGVAGDTINGGWVQRSVSRNETVQLTDDEKMQISTEIPEIIEKLNIGFAKIKPGKQLLSLEDGMVTLHYDLNKPPILWDPTPSTGEGTPITEISQLDMLMRDRRTFALVQQAIADGKQPIIAVGSSHVSTLQPAFDAAFKRV